MMQQESGRAADNSVRVLLIDDQAIVGEAVRRLLAEEPEVGFHFCSDAVEAIAEARRIKPTVILLDLVMPDIDGIQLVLGFRQNPETSDTPIIVLSSEEDPHVKRQAFAAGANDYLVKLPDAIELIARIRYHSAAYLSRLQRDEAFLALNESRQQLLNSNIALRSLNERLEETAAELAASNTELEQALAEREQAEKALRSQSAILQSILTSMGDGVVVADISGRTLLINPAAAWTVKTGGEEGRPSEGAERYGIFLPDAVTLYPPHEQPLARAIRGEPGDGEEMFVRHADAPEGVWLSATARPLQDENSRLIGGVVVLRDVTEAKRMQKALEDQIRRVEAANKELEGFSYSVSHDLRAPLRSIEGFSQMLWEDYRDQFDATAADYLHRVRAASQRMSQLIDALLILFRLARVEIRCEKVDVSALARAVAEEIRQCDPDRKAEFMIADGLAAWGDGRLLRVVLENLLGNAWKFTAKRPYTHIEVGVVAPGDSRPVFFVRDNGAGFDMTYADKLFGAFQRLHRTDEFPGTGIGLATVQRVINRHGGRIWAESVVDQGAAFYFSL